MTDERPSGQEPETDEERLKRPDDAAKDLDPAPEDADDVKGGVRKAGEKPLE